MKPVIVIAAVPRETALLEASLDNRTRLEPGALEAVEGHLGTQRVVVCTGGIGKVNAAVATTALIERMQPQLVINTGCAGAYPGSGLSIGDLAVASEEVLGDEGVITSGGWLDFRAMGLPMLVQGEERYYNEIPLSRHTVDSALRLAALHGTALARGRFVTVSTCSGTRMRGEELVQRIGAIAENMEGAAVALTCLRYGIDCLEIRGISNQVEERNMEGWDIPAAVEAAQRFVIRFIEELDRQ